MAQVGIAHLIATAPAATISLRHPVVSPLALPRDRMQAAMEAECPTSDVRVGVVGRSLLHGVFAGRVLAGLRHSWIGVIRRIWIRDPAIHLRMLVLGPLARSSLQIAVAHDALQTHGACPRELIGV